MGNSKLFIAITFGMVVLWSCNSSENGKTATDSSVVNNKINEDTVNRDTTPVKQADSIHSYRNDRSTDSVGVGKTVPLKR